MEEDRMKKWIALAFTAAIIFTSCAGGSDTRTVLVDYKHDRFASQMLQYFPENVSVHPGDTLVFRQTWTGEPHSITMGTQVDKLGKLVEPYIKIFKEKGWEGLPQEAPPEIEKIEGTLPWMTDDDGNVGQNGAQPCYLKDALPPKKASQPCTDAQQRQPQFNGRYRYYNSGLIPYEGPNGDTFSVQIAKTARPGSHFFYCNYHGEFMSGWLHIRKPSEKIPSQETVSRQAQQQIDVTARPLLREFRRAQQGKAEPSKDEAEELRKFGLVREEGGKTYAKAWFAGYGADNVDNALINEFIPKRVTAKVGDRMTWLVVGTHTISFHVPKYFPIYEVAKNGNVRLNPKIRPPAGGAPDISKMGEEEHEGPPEFDGRSWNGRGFWSTGLIESEDFAVYHLKVTKPGTYSFACLIHPPMVGTLVVTR
jgi:plastocyanin